jgi:hypothetical protein
MLDNNRIAIRERNLLEVMDLALSVLREQGRPLLGLLGLGAVPMLLLNMWLLAPEAHFDYATGEPPSEYLLWLLLTMMFETPLAMAPATLYLGQSMFSEQASVRQVLRDFRRAIPQLVWFQVLLRGGMVLLWFLIFPLTLPYVGWPYLNEIILLERNPLFAGQQKRLTTWKRSRALHGGNVGDLLARWLGSLLVGALLTVSLCLALWAVLSQLSGGWYTYHTLFWVFLPVSLWTVIGYFTVVRFLCYLDLRIRREGWEVELTLRAEAQKLGGSLKWNT